MEAKTFGVCIGLWVVPLCLFCTALPGQTPQGVQPSAPSDPRMIATNRPLAEAADLLQHIYGKVITYEDPILVWDGDLTPSGRNATGRHGVGPKALSFRMPAETGSEPDVSAVLAKTLAGYHQQTDGPRFQLLTSRFGLHIIPAQVREQDGRMAQAHNPLDE